MPDRDSNNAIEHAIKEWDGVNAGPAHGVLVRAARELLEIRRGRVAATVTDDEIIDVRDGLLAKGNPPTLSVHDQNLLRDSEIALGLVRCKPETREEARARVARAVVGP